MPKKTVDTSLYETRKEQRLPQMFVYVIITQIVDLYGYKQCIKGKEIRNYAYFDNYAPGILSSYWYKKLFLLKQKSGCTQSK